ncbi:protein Largen-like [Callorhinchus milii]|uniref:Proline-rich protein 16-like n=1 Tax=Callorhinchus milii TaxID=7868 RepID=A0A4W3GKA1_CALMI|nr:protein Largen-like [Callorhinchus milii]|eukprot:gi/632978890/ref/XP_007906165.1/ PREDICTED: proline-rich protein 16-like [Callorhinchus milii]
MSRQHSSTAADLKGRNVQYKVKEQIMCVVQDLELVLGELKSVSSEMREVVGQIDHLTSDLNLCEDKSESYRSDTLDSSSSGVAMSTLEKHKDRPRKEGAILTVLRKSKPPPPPPRRTPVRVTSLPRSSCANESHKSNGTLVHGTHPPRDHRLGSKAACSLDINCPTWLTQPQMKDRVHRQPMVNSGHFAQPSSNCVLRPGSTVTVQQRDTCIGQAHCLTNSQEPPCHLIRPPMPGDTGESSTAINTKPCTKSRPTNPRPTLRKSTSTTV